ncbi:MAG: Holliday junction resolvase RuvX [Chloroflexota bacterium]
MRWLGLDVGDRTIGVAVSDPLGITAQGIEVIRRRTAEADFARLAELAREYGVGGIVVGLPRNMNGTIGPRGEQARAFAAECRERLGLPVREWDERLSTVSAQRSLLEADVSRAGRRKVVDMVAASIILQNFIDSGAAKP